MKYLKKIWVRILLSLLLGGILAETVHVMKGSTSTEFTNILFRMGAVVSFILLSLIVAGHRLWYYFFPKPPEPEGSDEVLDDMGKME